jgi:hypothetical protein
MIMLVLMIVLLNKYLKIIRLDSAVSFYKETSPFSASVRYGLHRSKV